MPRGLVLVDQDGVLAVCSTIGGLLEAAQKGILSGSRSGAILVKSSHKKVISDHEKYGQRQGLLLHCQTIELDDSFCRFGSLHLTEMCWHQLCEGLIHFPGGDLMGSPSVDGGSTWPEIEDSQQFRP